MNVLNHNGQELEKQSAHFHSMTAQIRENRDLIMASHKCDVAATYLLQVMSEYAQQQNEIIQLIVDSRRSVVSHLLFTPKQLEKQLELVSKHVGGKFDTPRKIDVYACSKITHYVLGNQIVFKISIPLFKLKNCRLYKLTALPFLQNGKYLVIKSKPDFLLASLDKQFYQYSSETDVRRCKQLANRNGRNVFNHLAGDNCVLGEWKSDLFLDELSSGNEYIFVSNSPRKVKEMIMFYFQIFR